MQGWKGDTDDRVQSGNIFLPHFCWGDPAWSCLVLCPRYDTDPRLIVLIRITYNYPLPSPPSPQLLPFFLPGPPAMCAVTFRSENSKMSHWRWRRRRSWHRCPGWRPTFEKVTKLILSAISATTYYWQHNPPWLIESSCYLALVVDRQNPVRLTMVILHFSKINQIQFISQTWLEFF